MNFIFIMILIAFSIVPRAQAESNYLKYKIKKNDQLGFILGRMNICPLWGERGSVKKLTNHNQFPKGPNWVFPGQEINIPKEWFGENYYELDEEGFVKVNTSQVVCTKVQKIEIETEEVVEEVSSNEEFEPEVVLDKEQDIFKKWFIEFSPMLRLISLVDKSNQTTAQVFSAPSFAIGIRRRFYFKNTYVEPFLDFYYLDYDKPTNRTLSADSALIYHGGLRLEYDLFKLRLESIIKSEELTLIYAENANSFERVNSRTNVFEQGFLLNLIKNESLKLTSFLGAKLVQGFSYKDQIVDQKIGYYGALSLNLPATFQNWILKFRYENLDLSSSDFDQNQQNLFLGLTYSH